MKYDAEKLIAYPGFNVTCPKEVVDVGLFDQLRFYVKVALISHAGAYTFLGSTI